MKISVIMGVYNDSDTVEHAVNSILRQTYGDFEFIICDDCSSDGVYDQLIELSKLDDRIILLRNEVNMGLANTLNKCLEYSSGEYIARMDSDDESLVERFEEQVNFLDCNPQYAFCGTRAVVFDDEGDKTTTGIFGEISFDEMFKRGGFVHPSVMIRRDKLLQAGGYTSNKLTKRCEDYDLWNKLYFNGEKGYVLEKLLFRYRETAVNIKKRKFSHYIDRAKIAFYWRKKHKCSTKYIIWCIRPIIVGMMPKFVYRMLHDRRKK